MSEKKVLIICALFSLLIILGGVFFLTKNSASTAITASQNVKAAVEQKTYDFGQVSYQGENVVKSFVIKNSGTDALKLTNIKTSCHCTKAQVMIEGNVSSYFGMNSFSSWVGEVQPGKEATLTVVFDPKYHGLAGVGQITRLVAVETNDIQNPRLEFSLTGNVFK